MLRRIVVTAALLGSNPPVAAGTDAARACPELTGHYRVQGEASLRSEALKALQAGPAAAPDSGLRLQGAVDDRLFITWKRGNAGVMGTLADVVLLRGQDFECRDGWLILRPAIATSRHIDERWYEGNATLRVAPAPSGGLAIAADFSGRERTTIYAYDSARVSIPKPGSATRLSESQRWPDMGEPAPHDRTANAAPEPAPVRDVRRLLSPSLLGGVRMGALQARGDAVTVTFTAPRREDAVQFEDRLHAASISYDVERSPQWSNNAYELTLRLWPTSAGVERPWRPSLFRIEQELARLQHPMVSLRKVVVSDDGYVATLAIAGPEPAEPILARLRANARLFGEIELLDEAPQRGGSSVREMRLRLRLR